MSRRPDWPEVERALAAALELPEEQRPAFLANLTAPVRAEVESLLAAHLRAGSFLGGETERRSSAPDGRKPGVIQPDTQIGSYRIEALIGEGGMGTVYRALDCKLNRPVAIKFLFDELADAAGRRRFQREARMASSLNHPHILAVYDTGEFEGSQYLVTEFVDGGTLTSWARSEKRTWREIVALLTGVGDGLAAAHAAGILHRDIKPDNILVGRNGYAKLADFGLAKLEERSTPEAVSQTISSEITKRGIILGTVAYMSPEQASGRPTDARSDIFSFGIVMYELLAGRRPFPGQTDLEVQQNILHGSAAPLRDEVPENLRMVVEKAIEKDPGERYQGMRDLVVDIRRSTRQSVKTGRSGNVASPAETKRRWKISSLAASISFAVLLVGTGLLVWFRRPVAETPRQVVQFDISQPAETIFTPPIGRQPFAISPDGKRLAFVATGANGTNIWTRDLASPDMHPAPGTEGAWSIFWDPGSRSVFFSAKTILKQANLETGSTRTVAETSFIPQVGTWRANGKLILYLGAGDNFELRLDDGSLKRGPVFEGIRWPQVIQGSDRLVYSVYDAALQHSRAVVSDYVNGKPVTLMQTDSRVQFAPPLHPGDPGYLLFIRGASLLAQPFDAEHVKLIGEPFSIAPNVVYYGPNLSASFSASGNGVLVYQANFPVSELKWYDRAGKEVGGAGRPATFWGQVRISRDGQHVVASVWSPENGGTGLWVFDANGRESRRLTFPPEVHRRAVWSPDGTRLAFGRSPTVGGPELALLNLGGNGTPEAFENKSEKVHLTALPTDWSSDGRFIALDDGVGEEQQVAWIADLANHTLAPFLKNSFAQWGTAFSHDGKRIAFVSQQSGRPEVYVQGFDGTPSAHLVGDRKQVSRDGAWLVRWRADDRELFFVGLDNSLNAVPVAGTSEYGEPKLLFRIAGVPQYGTTRDFQFDVSPDGQRFIMPTTGSVPPPPFTVIENWQDKFHR